MSFQEKIKLIKNQSSYLQALEKEHVNHTIKHTIYELEKNNLFNDQELDELNKVILTTELFNNLYFKYNKQRLNNSGVIYLDEENNHQFTLSLLLNFKLRIPIAVHLYNDQQKKCYELFIQALNANNIETLFLAKLNE